MWEISDVNVFVRYFALDVSVINNFRKIITSRLTDRIEIHENRVDLAVMDMMMYMLNNMKFDFARVFLTNLAKYKDLQ